MLPEESLKAQRSKDSGFEVTKTSLSRTTQAQRALVPSTFYKGECGVRPADPHELRRSIGSGDWWFQVEACSSNECTCSRLFERSAKGATVAPVFLYSQGGLLQASPP